MNETGYLVDVSNILKQLQGPGRPKGILGYHWIWLDIGHRNWDIGISICKIGILGYLVCWNWDSEIWQCSSRVRVRVCVRVCVWSHINSSKRPLAGWIMVFQNRDVGISDSLYRGPCYSAKISCYIFEGLTTDWWGARVLLKAELLVRASFCFKGNSLNKEVLLLRCLADNCQIVYSNNNIRS